MRAKRTDANQEAIVKALRKMGWSVHITSMVGNGFGDIVCGNRGHNLIFEIKDGTKPPSQQRLTNLEHLFHLHWRGQIDVVTSIQDAIDIVSKL